MSYVAMYKVRTSGMTDRTQVDVLEALALHLNDETKKCCPSVEALSRISRVNVRLVQKTIKELNALGYISFKQEPGKCRYFTLNLDRLPQHLPDETLPPQESTPPNESTPLRESTPPNKSTGEGRMKVRGRGVENDGGPLHKTTPESVMNQEKNQKENQEVIAGDLFDNSVKLTKTEKPKRTRAKAKTQCPFTPDDEIPSDYLSYAQEKHSSIDALKEFRKFVNSAIANGRTYSDWKAAWRTWTANAEDWKPKTTYTPRNNAPFRFDDAYYGDGSF